MSSCTPGSRWPASTSAATCYLLDPLTLNDLGKCTWGERLPNDLGVSAHAKVDDHTGELLFFNYGVTAPYLRYGVGVTQGNRLVHYVPMTCRAAAAARHGLHQALHNPERHAAVLGSRTTRRACTPRGSTRTSRPGSRRPRRGGSGDIRWFEFDQPPAPGPTPSSGDEIVVAVLSRATKPPTPGPTRPKAVPVPGRTVSPGCTSGE